MALIRQAHHIVRNMTHPLQTSEWGAFREKTGVKVIKLSTGYMFTVHKLPLSAFSIGYFPKGPLPDKKMIEELNKLGRENKCIFVQLEPNVEVAQNSKVKSKNYNSKLKSLGLRQSLKPLFTKYNFVIDLTKSEEELLAVMHPKTRYNIRVAEKHGVKVQEETNDKGFKTYLKLYFETTRRQHYFGHTEKYHRLLWQTLTNHTFDKLSAGQSPIANHPLVPHILTAYYKGIPLTAWFLMQYQNTLYYPYGGSSIEHRNVMASNLVAWEAIKLGKKLGCKTFNMWGALGPNADPKDPWYGFHKFKQGYGGRLVEYVGSYDLVLNPVPYWMFHLIDKLRWLFLKLR
ncbi:peptidoglycan bridge formation glycyltransferase FemA/FemB family protein [Candidatus Microgenomates bacterium]|nr:peptidoglycan bridge formation glycyltransferase FemA/FemB family protein [Candidatus Microgenomates bacterium]